MLSLLYNLLQGNQMKKVFAILFAASMALGLASCASILDSNQTLEKTPEGVVKNIETVQKFNV